MQIGLNELSIGERAAITAVQAPDALYRRLLDLGLLEQAVVECVGRAPSGDPVAFLVCDAVIALRNEDCRRIRARRV